MARRILTEFVMDKIAAVDRPCQEHATVTIMKRAPEVKAFASDAAAHKALRSLAMLRTSVLKAKVNKAWTDAARAAALEARHAGGGRNGEVTAVAHHHGFKSELSGGAGSKEWEGGRKWKGHFISVSDNGNWSHVKMSRGSPDVLGSGKTALALHNHLSGSK